MKKLLFYLIFICTSIQSDAQQEMSVIEKLIDKAETANKYDAPISLFSVANHTSDNEGKYLNLLLNIENANAVIEKQPAYLSVWLPFQNNVFQKILLQRNDFIAGDCALVEAGAAIKQIQLPGQVSYFGTVSGTGESSLVTLTITRKSIRAIITVGNRQFTLAPASSFPGNSNYHFYERGEVVTGIPPLFCTMNTDSSFINHQMRPPQVADSLPKCIRLHFEIDYKLNNNWGGTDMSIDNFLFLINSVSALFKNENINIKLSYLKIWASPDPYIHAGSNALATLNSFSGSGEPLHGNFAQLLHGGNEGGYGYLPGSYSVAQQTNTIAGFPVYSYNVYLIAHELGHNFNSPHTHNCSWMGGPIDNCETQEGNCVAGPSPVNGGTIMSYCTNTIAGINFNHGFGDQPGNLIRNWLNNNFLFSSCSDMPACTDSILLGLKIIGDGLSWHISWDAVNGPVIVEQRDTANRSFSLLSIVPQGTDSITIPYRSLCDDLYKEIRFTKYCTTGTAIPLAVNLSRSDITYFNPVIKREGNTLKLLTSRINALYQWYKDGVAITGATGNTYLMTASGSYSVMEMLSNCTGTSSPYYFRLYLDGSQEEVRVFPNPGNTIIYAQTNDPAVIFQSYRIFDTQGRLVEQQIAEKQNLIQLDLRNLPAAVYMIKFTTTIKTVTKKIIKQ